MLFRSVIFEALTRSERADEFLLMGLRLSEGIDLGRFHALSGRPLDPVRIATLAGERLIAFTPSQPSRVHAAIRHLFL